MEAHTPGLMYAYDRAKQAMMLETDRPIALREAIMACRNGGTVSVPGVYGGFVDKLPFGSLMNRSLTIRAGQEAVFVKSADGQGPEELLYKHPGAGMNLADWSIPAAKRIDRDNIGLTSAKKQ